ncbi:hypothetical protein LMG667_02645 [Xanthomonas euvesicatoria]|uniref:hypothetical protein n=1 Tax=Xanthomonas euvesicatoria TaxID=456327 RepID=UPI00080E2B4A|nr:hypothetical protein [Xanthomonas euvesicatoria]OCG90335.1 hypothetical protein LMG667_02645 [Xanthomonas euvesicatoria]
MPPYENHERRTAKTEEFYAKTYKQLRQQAAIASGVQTPEFVAPIAIVEHLIARKSDLSKRTWQLYKSSVAAQFEVAIAEAPDRLVSQEYEYGLQRLRSERQTGAMTSGKKTSALKAKKLAPEDFATLTAYIERNVGNHKRARSLLVYCHASALLGLRPSEWESANPIQLEGRPALVVRNAKNTQGRGNGEFRTLDLSGLDKAQLGWVDEMLDLVDGHRDPGAYEDLQKKLGQYISWAARKALPRRRKYPSLYTFRHMFASDAKVASMAGGQDKAWVAALMGHASDATAERSYGKARFGRGGLAVQPVDAQVSSVRRKSTPAPRTPSN